MAKISGEKMKKVRHFVVTTFVVHKDKVLLVRHKKLGKWLSPGGHIELNELPEDAALRKVKEETGLNVKLIGKREKGGNDFWCKSLLMPFCVLLEDIALGHQHIDLIYVAQAKNPKIRTHDSWTAAKWWSAADLKSKEITPAVRYWALRAIKMVRG